MNDKIDQVSAEMAEIQAVFPMIEALLGGTADIRSSSSSFLPRYELESTESYKRRVSVTTVFPAFKQTVKQMAGRVFFKDFDIQDVNAELESYLSDFDMKGNSIEMFSQGLFKESVAFGLSYVVVDYSGNGSATLKEERDAGSRPFAYTVHPKQVLEARKGIVNGNSVITHFRYIHDVVIGEDELGQQTTQEVVLFMPDLVKRWRMSDKGQWVPHDERAISVGGKSLGYAPVFELKFDEESPLIDLAYLNVKHIQSQSDQDNIVNTARVPILKLTGVSPTGDDDATIKVGGSVITLEGEQDLSYVEHSGASISAGIQSLEKLEQQMQAAGARLLIPTKIALTDTQSKDEQVKEVSELRLYANMLEDVLHNVFDMMMAYLGGTDGGRVEISGGIDLDLSSSATTQELIALYLENIISKKTVFEEAKRRGVILDVLKYEEEEKRLELEQYGGLNGNLL